MSNSIECMKACIGKKIIGVLHDAIPLSRADLRQGTKTFIFDDGTGFTFKSNGAYWTESKEDITAAINKMKEEIKDNQLLLDLV